MIYFNKMSKNKKSSCTEKYRLLKNVQGVAIVAAAGSDSAYRSLLSTKHTAWYVKQGERNFSQCTVYNGGFNNEAGFFLLHKAGSDYVSFKKQKVATITINAVGILG